MTLDEIATATCLRFVRQDPATRTLAKAYVRQRGDMLWDAHNWRQAQTILTIPVTAGQTEIALGAGILRPLSVRWNTAMLTGLDHGTALHLLPETIDSAGTPIGYVELPRDATRGASIRLVQPPAEAGTLLVLAKRRFPGLPTDTSEYLIAGLDAALVAYALGDLWSYEGQEQKAAVKFNEAGQLAQKALDAEVLAGGVRPRLIPAYGIADDIDPY